MGPGLAYDTRFLEDFFDWIVFLVVLLALIRAFA